MTKAGNNIKVVVRVRPSLPRECQPLIVSMPSNEPGLTCLTTPNQETKKFLYDESVWSHNPSDDHFTDNSAFYQSIAPDLVDHLFQGFNVCLLAYGQTGSGKTYTMIGDGPNSGVIPLMVRDIFRHRTALVAEKINCELVFQYVEIYNEKVNDLLDGLRTCRVREHPVHGSYVENATELKLHDYEDFFRSMELGNKNRVTASTKMNDASSRSHAVLMFKLKQTRFSDEDDDGGMESVGVPIEEMVSTIKLVDLAGSERLLKTQVFGQADRLREGAQINKSLTVLGRCINILSQGSKGVVPYRDSTLTYLLRENLAGNSKTAMIFCISPCDYDETLQTLNYASQVKKIQTTARANSSQLVLTPIDWEEMKLQEDTAVAKLREQVLALTLQLESLTSTPSTTVDSLMKYLERQVETQEFEIRFLKNALASTQKKQDEHERHNLYLQQELQRLERLRIASIEEHLTLSLLELRLSCLKHAHETEMLMASFKLVK